MKKDLILIVPLILIAVIMMVVSSGKSSKGCYAVVEVDGVEIGTYPLDKNIIISLNGGTNTLEIKDGFAVMTQADCHDKTCIKQGKISQSGESIICLPNRISIKIIGENGGVDLVI